VNNRRFETIQRIWRISKDPLGSHWEI